MAVTSGPQAPFVPVVVTATGVDRNGAPVNPTAHFAVGTPVYVVCRVRGVLPGQSHRLTIRWYAQGQLAWVPGAYTSATVAHDGPFAFSVTYLSAGAGMVRLYWDEPIGDSNEQPSDHCLAQAIAFTGSLDRRWGGSHTGSTLRLSGARRARTGRPVRGQKP